MGARGQALGLCTGCPYNITAALATCTGLHTTYPHYRCTYPQYNTHIPSNHFNTLCTVSHRSQLTKSPAFLKKSVPKIGQLQAEQGTPKSLR